MHRYSRTTRTSSSPPLHCSAASRCQAPGLPRCSESLLSVSPAPSAPSESLSESRILLFCRCDWPVTPDIRAAAIAARARVERRGGHGQVMTTIDSDIDSDGTGEARIGRQGRALPRGQGGVFADGDDGAAHPRRPPAASMTRSLRARRRRVGHAPRRRPAHRGS